jgi:hypothetical protein
MLRKTPKLLLLATFGLACSARYEVGSMEPAMGGSAGSVPEPSTAGSMSVGGSRSAGTASGGYTSSSCIRRVTPEPVAVLVPPAVIWSRVAPLVWDDAKHDPPVMLPEEASYEWAGELVEKAFAAARVETGSVPGASSFIRSWLRLTQDPFDGDYDTQLASEDSVMLEVLLQSSWAPGHVGVFSEAQWLFMHPSIPARGAQISSALFGKNVPAPPPGVNRNVYDGELTERQAIEMTSGAQPACASCHNMMNPLGFALGHFDREGSYRELDHGQEIDTTGSYETNAGVIEFDGIADFGAKAAESCDANQAIVDSFLRVALANLGYGDEAREALITEHTERIRSAYVMGGRSYLALVKGYAQSPLTLRQ